MPKRWLEPRLSRRKRSKATETRRPCPSPTRSLFRGSRLNAHGSAYADEPRPRANPAGIDALEEGREMRRKQYERQRRAAAKGARDRSRAKDGPEGESSPPTARLPNPDN